MKLVAAVVLLCIGCSYAARQSNLYKNKRIIKVRVPPRPYPNFYNGPKGYLRPSGSPIRFKDYHTKHYEFARPGSPPFYNSFNNVYVKHQSRPPPLSIQSESFYAAGFGQPYKGFAKEVHQKIPLTYGSSFPHNGPISSFKFPSLKDEIHITHTKSVSSSAAPIHSSSPTSSSSSSGSSSFSSAYRPTTYFAATSHSHVQSSGDDRGAIKEIPAPNLGPKPDVPHGEEYSTYGKGPSIDVTNLVSDNGGHQLTFPATDYYSLFGQSQNFEIDNNLSGGNVYASGLYNENHDSSFTDGSAQVALLEDSSIVPSAVSDLAYKNNVVSYSTATSPQVTVSPIPSPHTAVTPAPSPSAGYEVTEEPHTASGQSDKGDSHYYYAPDPDPSLPVHKVPPRKEILTDEKLAETYVPSVSQNFQILEGGTVASPLTTLSTQELFHLMHGFPRQIPVVAEPVVAIVGHQQPGIYIQPTYQYTQTTHNAGDTTQYQQTELSEKEGFVAQPQYQAADTQQTASYAGYNTDDSNNNQYEPETSESREHNSIRNTEDESLNSVDNTSHQEENQIFVHFNKLPEVPFFTTLPNKAAAEALASLQAAGSIGSNYVNQIKAVQEEKQTKIIEPPASAYVKLRGDQGAPAQDEEEEEDLELSDVDHTQQQLEAEPEQEEVTRTSVEIQKSIPLYETSYAASSLLDDANKPEMKELDVKSEPFGKRIKPK